MQNFLFFVVRMLSPQHPFRDFPCRSCILDFISVLQFLFGTFTCCHIEDITQLRPCSTLPAATPIPNRRVDVFPYNNTLLQKRQMMLFSSSACRGFLQYLCTVQGTGGLPFKSFCLSSSSFCVWVADTSA